MASKRLFVLELNEFNKDLLQAASKEFGFKNIQKLFTLNHITTTTNDTYDSDYLEPWVQWVNVHTGKLSSDHKIKHLGDIPDCSFPQIWEALSEKNISSGVWGVLNGAKGNAENCSLFLPDPWTFSEQATPEKYNSLLGFPRYFATHRTDIKLGALSLHFLRFLKVLFSPIIFFDVLANLPKATATILTNIKHEFAGFCFVEYLSSLLFLKTWHKKRLKFGMLFINGLAHLQHYHWRGPLAENKKMKYCLYFIDKLVGKVFNTLGPEDELIVLNALAQMNTTSEPDYTGYRAFSFDKFLELGNIKYTKVESLMSTDAFVFFNSEEDAEHGYKVLSEAKINDSELLFVERDKYDKCKVFFRPVFYDPVNNDAVFQFNGKTFNFLENFKPLGIRTGKHIQEATMFTSLEGLPEKIENRLVFDIILNFFSDSKVKIKSQNNINNEPLNPAPL